MEEHVGRKAKQKRVKGKKARYDGRSEEDRTPHKVKYKENTMKVRPKGINI